VALSNVSAHHSVSLDDVITVAFNQPMDQQAFVAGLHIQPATQVRTTWKGNDLLITPVHASDGQHAVSGHDRPAACADRFRRDRAGSHPDHLWHRSHRAAHAVERTTVADNVQPRRRVRPEPR